MTCKEAINILNQNTYYCVYDVLSDLIDEDIQIELQDREICDAYERGTLICRLEDGYIGISGVTITFTDDIRPKDLEQFVTYCEYEVSGYKPIFSPKKPN